LRTVLALACLVGFFFTAFGSPALAGDNTANPAAKPNTVTTEGSTLRHRSQVDENGGQVYIYVGGSLPVGTHLAAFQYLFDFTEAGNTTGYITPLLFERRSSEAYTLYTVAGIGKGFKVGIEALPRAIPFDVVEGIKVGTNGNFTFGFINAIVDATGASVAASAGAVDMDNPADSGEGVGGTGSTNDWTATNVSPNPVVALGTTFGASGSNADYTFYGSYRTYSAQAVGILVKP